MASQGQQRGDAAGRRIWRRRAELLEQASQVASILRLLLEQSDDVRAADAKAIEARVADTQRIAIERGGGRIESRKRFRRPGSTGSPIREQRPLNWLHVDEGGVDRPARGDKSDAWFALAGVAMTLDQARAYEDAADQVKQEFFNRTDITLHEPAMRRNERIFNLGDDPSRQRAFQAAVDELIQSAEFTAFAVGIRKWEYRARFTDLGTDPYLPTGVYDTAMQMLLERYVDYLHHQGADARGRVTLEAQGSREDAAHQRAYVDLLLNGTQWVPESAFRSYLETGVRFKGKQGSHPLEISDMLARDTFEWIRSDCLATPRRWPIFEEKFYRRGDLRAGTFGLKVFPAADIREQVEAHREKLRTRLRRP